MPNSPVLTVTKTGAPDSPLVNICSTEPILFREGSTTMPPERTIASRSCRLSKWEVLPVLAECVPHFIIAGFAGFDKGFDKSLRPTPHACASTSATTAASTVRGATMRPKSA